ncbi:hypothetical protein MWU59_07235 [Flavobacteriaceae bacterium F08102]|nr:hypothetical protein [Flavobacteriaceae bacterium F08102]
MAEISFREEYDETFGSKLQYPVFSKNIKGHEGKKVTIKGDFLDLDPLGEFFFHSENPLYACFFCGDAGVESVVELDLEQIPDIGTDDLIQITGILKLNTGEISQLLYTLTTCSIKKVD